MSAHDDAMNWLRWQWYSSGQINDAISKVRQQQNSGMSRSDIMNNVRNNSSSYFGWSPMYGSSSYSSWGGWEDTYKPSYEELHPARTTNMWGKDYSLQTHEDWSVTVTTWWRSTTIDKAKNWALYDSIMNHYNWLTSKQTNKNPNMTGNESGLWDQKANTADAKAWENFDNAVAHYVSQWYSLKKANEMAQVWLEGKDTVSETKQDKDAELQWPASSDDDDNNSPINGVEPTTQENSETKTSINEDPTNGYLSMDDLYNDVVDYAQKQVDGLINSNTTESNVVTNKAQVSKDPIFDYNTYFNDNLAPNKNVWETGAVKAKPYDDSIKDVKTYQDEAISSLQSLWFLEPNAEAAATMPDTEEQSAPEIADTPESLAEWFDNELTELWNTSGLAPQAVAQTYVDYKNRLAKYIKDNNISDEEAAAMYDSLKNNEKFKTLLNQSRK